MPSRRRLSSGRKRSYLSRSSRTSSKFKRRRSTGRMGRTARKFGGFRKFRGGGHKRLSKQVIKSFFPDIAKSMLVGHHIWTGIPCNDIATALNFKQGTTTSNTITVCMNSNPNGGMFYTQPGTDTESTDKLNPVTTYKDRYTKYRPMGCKVVVTVFTQDNGEVAPEGSASNIQVATPFMLYGFPFLQNDESTSVSFANSWSGAPGNGFTADTIPQMKYGFRRISSGLGGKSSVKYSTYWDFAKLAGLTRDQYLSSDYFVCHPDDNTARPAQPIFLCLALADYTPALQRLCTVDIKIVQYGRWEGQELVYE